MATVAPLQCLIIGTPGDVRVTEFRAALQDVGHPAADVVSYPDWVLLSDDERRERIEAADRVRVESPGRDPKVLHAIRWGELHQNKPMNTLPNDAIGHPSSFAAAIAIVMKSIDDACRSSNTILLNHPRQIVSICDKVRTVEKLRENRIPVPAQLATPQRMKSGDDQIREVMRSTGNRRVFIKLQHGFSGSGIVAYQVGKSRELAITTVAMEETAEGIQLFNTRKIQRYVDRKDIRNLLDVLCPLGVYVERWIPKAGVNNRATDLRVITIAGKVRHIVMRMSKTPITNLHLLNERSGPEPLRQQMRPGDWDALIETCERVARCFPQMLYLGIDVAVHADLRKHTVFEVNAWGDLLKGITDQGQTTYEAEVKAMADWTGCLD